MANLQVLLKRVDPRAVEVALPLFDTVDLAAGRLVTEEGDLRDALLFIERGAVDIEAGGLVATRLEAGALLGEIALFTDGTRTATARATEPVRVRVLRRAAYETLRNGGNAVACELERLSVENLARRLRELSHQIAEHGARSSLVAPATGKLAGGRPVASTPGQIVRRLGAIGAFADAPAEALAAFASELTVRTWAQGEKLGAAGQDAPGFVIVLSGEVELVAAVTDTRGVRLTTGSLGTLVGVAALVDHAPMGDWVTALTPVTALRAEPSQFQRWFRADDRVGGVVRVACICDLADQVTNANAALALISLLGR
jgi:CRP-like cAMP-binding protein